MPLVRRGATSGIHPRPGGQGLVMHHGSRIVRHGDGTADLGAGDSFAVPRDTPYAFEVLEAATVVEAVSPPSALGG